MDFKIKNKRALVFAGSKGLGFFCALALAREKCNVHIVSRNINNLKIAQKKIVKDSGNNCVKFTKCNIKDSSDVKNFFMELSSKKTMPDILITNCGVPPSGNFKDMSSTLYKKWLDIGIVRIVEILQMVIPNMIQKQWGRIIAISSISVKEPIENLVLSNTFRSGMTGFLKTVANEVGIHGITVNSLLPGLHFTDRLKNLYGKNDKLLENTIKSIPSKKIGNPEDFGAIASFLSSEYTNYITGQCLVVDGGKCSCLF